MLRHVRADLLWAASIVGVALFATLLLRLGYINAETTQRVVAMNGLMIAWYGNRMPKLLAPSADAWRLSRVAGWSLFISGLIYAGFWALATIEMAAWVGTGAVVGGIAVTMVYALQLRLAKRN